MSISVDWEQDNKWKDVRRFTDRRSAFAHPQFVPGSDNMDTIHECLVLVVGAGGLGCEILKDLAMSGFRKIEVIDMDTVDLSNLNRQFLFREKDIGKPKAEIAANFVMECVKDCTVVPHVCKIQDLTADFYRRFSIVICGLDSINARRWLNAMMCDLVMFDEDGEINLSTIIPLIDGGTEGFKGNSRVIIPFVTPCVECTIDLYPPQVNYPMCTIAHTPRLPEHCVEYVKVVQWDEDMPFDGPLDADNPNHVKWVCTRAVERAEKYNIQGVDLRLTLGVLKRIIPAVASTNAVIAGSCVLEAVKLASNISCPMQNYLNFADIDGVNFSVVKMERNPDCIVCSRQAVTLALTPATTVEKLLATVKERFVLHDPSINSSNGIVYMISSLMPDSKDISETNLKKTLSELDIKENTELAITDETLTRALTVRVHYPTENV